jgi:hypothetical protein
MAASERFEALILGSGAGGELRHLSIQEPSSGLWPIRPPLCRFLSRDNKGDQNPSLLGIRHELVTRGTRVLTRLPRHLANRHKLLVVSA